MHKNLLFIIPAIGISSLCAAQSLSPAVISSAGGNAKTDVVTLEWTLGESAVKTNSANEQIYTDGFHQPEIRVLGIVAQNQALSNSFAINIAPNPVKSTLSVTIQSAEEMNLLINLTDLNGKSIAETRGTFKNDSKEVDMSAFAAGIYLLNIKNEKGILIKTFKIAKQ